MPLVSVIVPCYNEQSTIRMLLDALYQQTYPRQEMEVIIADGLSTDNTRQEIASFQREHPDLCLHIVDNNRRIIPAGLNRAMEAASGQYILRLDAHSIPYPDYVARCVLALEHNLGDNIGGVWEIRPAGSGGWARAIATAAAHPLGVGDAAYRYTDRPQKVDTVPFGAFRHTLIDRIGSFDETLQTNEDYEFNVRVRQAGGTIWLDPAIRSIYFARPTLGALARQYWRYGYWKGCMLRRYPNTIRWRQALPPIFVVSLLVLALSALRFPIARWVLGAELLVYALTLWVVSVRIYIKKHDLAILLGLPIAIAIMHLSWGTAILWSLLKSP